MKILGINTISYYCFEFEMIISNDLFFLESVSQSINIEIQIAFFSRYYLNRDIFYFYEDIFMFTDDLH